MAAMCIYPRYFSFIFLVLLMLASIFADFSRLYEVPHLEEATFRIYQSKFLRLKRKLFVSRPVCLWTKHGYLCYSLPVKIDLTVHMDVQLNPGPTSSSSRSIWKRPYRGCRSGRAVRAREATKVFNIQAAMTLRLCHQFAFHSGRNENNLVRIPLISSGQCCSPPLRFGVWNARSLKTKVSSLCDLMLSHRLDLLSVTESWLAANDSITIADLTNSLKDYAVYHLPRSTHRGGGLAVIARKGFQVTENEGCMFSTFEHFDLTITSGNKVFRLVTVYRPPPSKKKMVLQ